MFANRDDLTMTSQTRQQLDTVLGWIGCSLSYTEQDPAALVDFPVLGDLHTPRDTSSGQPSVSARRMPGSVANTSDAKRVMQMLEDCAEGLQVCARRPRVPSSSLEPCAGHAARSDRLCHKGSRWG